MNSDRIRIAARSVALGLALIALSGCETMMSGPPDAAKFGDANRMTMMAQVVDPDPQYDEPMTGNGANTAQAVERYLKDAVKRPIRVRTTTSVGGSGN
jgi:hypothetical protein